MKLQINLPLILVGAVLFLPSLAASQTLVISENKRLESPISAEVMNRLAVANDRIVNVFGDEGTFVTQTDDQTGQVFIKPTAENGDKPLSITLITENNVTQDLTLTPTEGPAATVILKNPAGNTQNPNLVDPAEIPATPERNNSIQEQFIQVMKHAVLGELGKSDKKVAKRYAPKGLKLSYEKAYQSGPLVVSVWQVKNACKFSNELNEKEFYQKGDLALSLQKPILEPGEKTQLYILGRS